MQSWGEQLVVGPATHLPPPSHFEVPMMFVTLVPAWQAAAAQIVPAA
jgi:hypothetical protein